MTKPHLSLAVILKAGPLIGTGHLMRVRRLLPYLKVSTCELYADEISADLSALTADFAAVHVLPLNKLADAVLASGADAVLIDHYCIDSAIERPLHAKLPVFVIDDLADRPHDCTLLFDQGIDREARAYTPLVNATARVYTGTAYAMLNPALIHIPPRSFSTLQLGQRTPKVLVCFGGSDPVHGCRKTLQAIQEGRLWQHWYFTIIAGAGNSDYATLKALCLDLSAETDRITLLHHCSDMPTAYAQHDLAVGAYGVMFGERLSAGLPAVCVTIADNQVGADAVLQRHQLGVDLKLDRLASPQALQAALTQLLKIAPQCAAHGRALYDGQGLQRMAARINHELELLAAV